jgi:hypothetical protein
MFPVRFRPHEVTTNQHEGAIFFNLLALWIAPGREIRPACRIVSSWHREATVSRRLEMRARTYARAGATVEREIDRRRTKNVCPSQSLEILRSTADVADQFVTEDNRSKACSINSLKINLTKFPSRSWPSSSLLNPFLSNNLMEGTLSAEGKAVIDFNCNTWNP